MEFDELDVCDPMKLDLILCDFFPIKWKTIACLEKQILIYLKFHKNSVFFFKYFQLEQKRRLKKKNLQVQIWELPF